MSVYIPGMEMPTRCWDCLLNTYGYCMASNKHSDIIPSDAPIPDWCPLVPVPEHGRLIDADKQDAQIEALIERHLHGYTKSTWDFVCELRDILKRNRTIIPADKEEQT